MRTRLMYKMGKANINFDVKSTKKENDMWTFLNFNTTV